LFVIAVVLQNAETVYPEIPLANISHQAYCVVNNGWELITREPQTARFLESLDIAAVCADALDTAPYIAQSHVPTARRIPGETVEMDVDEVERWKQLIEPSLVEQWCGFPLVTWDFQARALFTVDDLALLDPSPYHSRRDLWANSPSNKGMSEGI
jgi:hypothetical protein